jgi:DHA1 family bicyclomycin/chloramphenicol resistance-like MFS transporter
MNRKQQTIVILILGLLATISPFAIDMYLPGFPAIASDLNTSIERVQLSLTSYFIGIAVGQLLYGPLLDRFGRKRPLYLGLAVYILASLGCAFTTSVDALITMRFLQALGGCAGMVAAQALVRDLFPLERTAQAFSLITLVVAVSPMVAPTVGGYMTLAFGWHSIFVTLAVVTALIVALVYFILPQGRLADDTISLKPIAVIKNFYHVIRQPQFITYSVAGGLATSAPFAYIAGSSYVFMKLYHTSEQEYGWIFGLVGAVIIGSTQLNHLFLKWFKSEQIVNAALLYQIVTGSLLVFGAWYNLFDKTGLVVMIAIFLAGHGLTNPNATALALAPFSKRTGSAASLSGSFRMAMGGIVSALVSFFHNGTQMPMILMMVLCAASGYVALLLGKGVVRYKANREDVETETVII